MRHGSGHAARRGPSDPGAGRATASERLRALTTRVRHDIEERLASQQPVPT
ncbi:hypothetical protein [Streptomyces sp. NBC_00151]|uniref:hypothetical protein n=1 Tax=Streptomyces sp. NBC_00151 TaxID=2975669 RepID=UPI002DDAEDF1|nr:hypothetical protein [Streptomyces sp. NBC_00151]WRZ45572.1 hypothetical protein OG915_43040 [Streptomyces sp. NBC_00151]